MRIIADSSMIDVYGMDGLVFHNGFTFSSSQSRGMRLFSTGGEVIVKSIKVYRLKGMNRQGVTHPETNADSPEKGGNSNKEQSVNSLGLILGIGGAVLAGACVTAAVKIMRKKQ